MTESLANKLLKACQRTRELEKAGDPWPQAVSTAAIELELREEQIVRALNWENRAP